MRGQAAALAPLVGFHDRGPEVLALVAEVVEAHQRRERRGLASHQASSARRRPENCQR